jgi:hypothetical protein
VLGETLIFVFPVLIVWAILIVTPHVFLIPSLVGAIIFYNVLAIAPLVLLFFAIGLFVRRLHDIGLSGWIICVPGMNILMLIALIFWSGQKKFNQFGEIPPLERSIQGAIFNTGSGLRIGDKWIPGFFSALLVLSVGAIIVAQTNAVRYFGITPLLFAGPTYNIAGQLVPVSYDAMRVLCNGKQIEIKKAAAFAQLNEVLSAVIPECSGNFDGTFLYGTNNVFEVSVRSSAWFSLNERYLVIIWHGTAGDDVGDYAFVIYRTDSDFSYVYGDDFGILPNLKAIPSDAISFKDLNGDKVTDLELCLPAIGYDDCQVVFSGSSTDTFSKWQDASRDPQVSYSVRDRKTYYNNILVQGTASNPFHIINGEYGDDDSGVYFEGNRIFGADATTFRAVPEPFGDTGLWGKDAARVYYNGNVLENSIAKYFSLVTPMLGTDGINIFYGIRAINNADAKTFMFIGGDNPYYAKDSQQVYFDGNVDENPVIAGADPMTFSIVGGDYSKDDKAVFYQIAPILGADLRTFIYLGEKNSHQYAKDENFLYKDGRIVPGIDPNSFVVP